VIRGAVKCVIVVGKHVFLCVIVAQEVHHISYVEKVVSNHIHPSNFISYPVAVRFFVEISNLKVIRKFTRRAFPIYKGRLFLVVHRFNTGLQKIMCFLGILQDQRMVSQQHLEVSVLPHVKRTCSLK